MFTFGVIPARGGSKRLPRKNVRDLCGKPLIAWTIEAAEKSQLDEFIVSTDDTEIASVAWRYGADVPFQRPAELSTDTAKSVDVMIHAAQWCEANIERPDYIFLLQPTSPTRTYADIDLAIESLKYGKSQGYVTLNQEGKANGLLYATSWDLLMKDHVIWNMYSMLYMCLEDVIDIDTEDDWKRAEKKLCR